MCSGSHRATIRREKRAQRPADPAARGEGWGRGAHQTSNRHAIGPGVVGSISWVGLVASPRSVRRAVRLTLWCCVRRLALQRPFTIFCRSGTVPTPLPLSRSNSCGRPWLSRISRHTSTVSPSSALSSRARPHSCSTCTIVS
eukprot:7279314-Prymnesium_polylepis.1